MARCSPPRVVGSLEGWGPALLGGCSWGAGAVWCLQPQHKHPLHPQNHIQTYTHPQNPPVHIHICAHPQVHIPISAHPHNPMPAPTSVNAPCTPISTSTHTPCTPHPHPCLCTPPVPPHLYTHSYTRSYICLSPVHLPLHVHPHTPPYIPKQKAARFTCTKATLPPTPFPEPSTGTPGGLPTTLFSGTRGPTPRGRQRRTAPLRDAQRLEHTAGRLEP